MKKVTISPHLRGHIITLTGIPFVRNWDRAVIILDKYGILIREAGLQEKGVALQTKNTPQLVAPAILDIPTGVFEGDSLEIDGEEIWCSC